MIETIYFPKTDVSKYHSHTQIVKKLTEEYIVRNCYCPICGSSIFKYEENHHCADFYCNICREDYELKSKKNKFGNKIVDGEYNTMIEKINSKKPSNFLFLTYKENIVIDLFTIQKFFFTPQIIEKRKPLSETAKRSGWTGCNILYKNLPDSAKIFYIKNSKILNQNSVLKNYKKVSFIAEKPIESKGWLLDVMFCIENLHKDFFNLNDIYKYGDFLKKQHPDNNHIQDKIRQQLQLLRDRGFIEFIDKGKYKLIK